MLMFVAWFVAPSVDAKDIPLVYVVVIAPDVSRYVI